MKKWILLGVGLVLMVVMVWLLFRDTDWNEVGKAVDGANWPLLMLSIVPMFLSHPARVRRWSFIVRAVHPATFWQMFSATQIGFLANMVLPARAGEVIRPLVLTRLTRLPFSKSMALNAVDRLTDLFGLLAVMAVSLIAFQPAGDLSIPSETFGTEEPITFTQQQYHQGAIGTGILLLVIVAGFVGLYTNRNVVIWISAKVIRKPVVSLAAVLLPAFVWIAIWRVSVDFLDWAFPVPIIVCLVGGMATVSWATYWISTSEFDNFSKRLPQFINGMINHFADGLHVFQSPVELARSIGWSLVTWGLNLLGIAIGLWAFGIEFPWYTPFVMQAILAVAIAAPNTPGFVGPFHIAIVLALVVTIPNADVNAAKAYAIVMHLWQFPAVLLFGFWCLMRDNMNLFELQREGQEQAKEAAE